MSVFSPDEHANLPKGCKAVIALTSWKKRIKTVGLTIFQLYRTCPGFHIVLTLSKEEFPKGEQELPKDLRVLATNGVCELLWVNKNYKSFKKLLFASMKYRSVPVISADDDCIYRFNYAEQLYRMWKLHPHERICYWCSSMGHGIFNTSGYATLHPPGYYKDAALLLNDEIVELREDDLFYAAICELNGNKGCICLNKDYNDVVVPHDEIAPLHAYYRKGQSPKDRYASMLNAIKRARDEHNRK